MEINTKFNVEDEVYLLHSNKIVKAKIIEIHITSFNNNKGPYMKITYALSLPDKYRTQVEEKELFITKQELLDSL